ncbi:hypothetical protein MSPP1_001291 [Malassezia sp. CBS 17886]|nr:hypothetical protein MSPP1_001291 [Malassezia sp. CBS 17886]
MASGESFSEALVSHRVPHAQSAPGSWHARHASGAAAARDDPSRLKDGASLRKPEVGSPHEDYMNAIVAPSLADLEPDARVHDAAGPGMGLLLSLSQKLPPSVESNSVAGSFEFPGASMVPSSMSATVSPRVASTPGESVGTGAHSDRSSARSLSPAAGAAPVKRAAGPSLFGPVNQVTPESLLSSLSNTLPSSGMLPMGTSAPYLNASFANFDTNAHLDSIASAATAAAATQFSQDEKGVHGMPHMQPALAHSFSFQTDPAAYLTEIHQASVGTPPLGVHRARSDPLRTESDAPRGGEERETAALPASYVARKTPALSSMPKFDLDQRCHGMVMQHTYSGGSDLGPSTPTSLLPSSTPPPRAPGFEPHHNVLHLAGVSGAQTPQTPPANVSATPAQYGMPVQRAAHGQSLSPALDDEESQQRAIEEAVRSLNAHHQMAQSAALLHHQKLNMESADPGADSSAHAVERGLPCGTAPRALAASPVRIGGDADAAPLAAAEHPSVGAPRTLQLPGASTHAQSLAPAHVQAASAVAVDRAAAAPGEPCGVPDSRADTASPGDMQKKFQCPKCPRAFARAYNLNTHLSTHDPNPSRAKPFPCPYRSCKAEGGRSFSRKHDLQRHVASVHEWESEPGINGSTGEVGEGTDAGGLISLGLSAPGKKFRCEDCGRAFVRRDALRRHHCDKATSGARKAALGGARNAAPSKMPPVAAQPARAYSVRGFPGEVVQQVAMQLMAEAQARGGMQESTPPAPADTGRSKETRDGAPAQTRLPSNTVAAAPSYAR